jgi:hypothetical protein
MLLLRRLVLLTTMRTILTRSSLRSRVGPLLLMVAMLVLVQGGGTANTNTLLLVIANLRATVLLSLILILCVTGTADHPAATIR